MSHEFICIVASVPRLLSPSLAALRSSQPANMRCPLRARLRLLPRRSRAQRAAFSSSSTRALRAADVSCNMSSSASLRASRASSLPHSLRCDLSRLRICGVRCVRGGVPLLVTRGRSGRRLRRPRRDFVSLLVARGGNERASSPSFSPPPRACVSFPVINTNGRNSDRLRRG